MKIDPKLYDEETGKTMKEFEDGCATIILAILGITSGISVATILYFILR